MNSANPAVPKPSRWKDALDWFQTVYGIITIIVGICGLVGAAYAGRCTFVPTLSGCQCANIDGKWQTVNTNPHGKTETARISQTGCYFSGASIVRDDPNTYEFYGRLNTDGGDDVVFVPIGSCTEHLFVKLSKVHDDTFTSRPDSADAVCPGHDKSVLSESLDWVRSK